MGKPHKYADSRLTVLSSLPPERLLALATGVAAQVRGGLFDGQQPIALLVEGDDECAFAVRTGLLKTDQLTFSVSSSVEGSGMSSLLSQILQYRTVQQTVNFVPVTTKQMVGLPLYLRFGEQLGRAIAQEDPDAEVHLFKGPREIASAPGAVRLGALGAGAVATESAQDAVVRPDVAVAGSQVEADSVPLPAPSLPSSDECRPQPLMAVRGLCPGCGESIAPQDLFCGECGCALPTADEPGDPAESQQVVAAPVAPATVAEPEVGLTSIILPAPVVEPRPEPAPARPVPELAPAVFRVGERPRPPQPDRATETRARLVLDDRTELFIDGGAVIGRDPAPTSAVPGAALFAIDDPGHSLSKTHAALVVEGAGAWVIDLHSSNGTAVLVDACRVPCPSGERVAVPDGAVLELGARSATVHLEARR